MRWKCPHCSIGLEASDEQISSAWLFSLCSTCLRFGLVRAGGGAVKVDRAPAGENFIRATPSEEVTNPTIRRAELRSKKVIQTEAVKPAETAPVEKTRSSFKFVAPVKLPEPLPEVPESRRATLPRLVLFGCLCVLAWNGYRYLKISDTREGRNLSSAEELSDQVTAKAMAPIRIEVGSLVEARSDRMQIRNGPGLQFPVIGELNLSKPYKVLSAEEPWFQLQAGTQTPAWVMSDEISPAN